MACSHIRSAENIVVPSVPRTFKSNGFGPVDETRRTTKAGSASWLARGSLTITGPAMTAWCVLLNGAQTAYAGTVGRDYVPVEVYFYDRN